ncbi:hypothetical protein [Streptomyces sp. NPDC056883]|uniref:hypothetical protein n=1 Tax=Streptomyces sp. NPDC056883 TaxID=3345959 RepID=UPI00367B98BD
MLDNAASEEQVRPLLPGGGASRALITTRRLPAGLEGVRELALGPLPLPESTELLTGMLGERSTWDKESTLAGLGDGAERRRTQSAVGAAPQAAQVFESIGDTAAGSRCPAMAAAAAV